MTEQNFWGPDPEDYIVRSGIGYGVVSFKDKHRWKILKEFSTYKEALFYAECTYGVPRVIVE